MKDFNNNYIIDISDNSINNHIYHNNKLYYHLSIYFIPTTDNNTITVTITFTTTNTNTTHRILGNDKLLRLLYI